MAITIPVKIIINHNTFRWANNSIVRLEKMSRECARVGIDQSCRSIKAVSHLRFIGPVCLHVIELSWRKVRHKNTPHIAPAIRLGIIVDNCRRLVIFDGIVEENTHRRRTATKDNELHPAIVNNRSIRERMSELKRCRGLGMKWHKHRMVPTAGDLTNRIPRKIAPAKKDAF